MGYTLIYWHYILVSLSMIVVIYSDSREYRYAIASEIIAGQCLICSIGGGYSASSSGLLPSALRAICNPLLAIWNICYSPGN
jgi:hypothetical protein